MDWSDFSLLSLHFLILKGRNWYSFLQEVKHKAALKMHVTSIKGLSWLLGHSSSQSTWIESKDGGDGSRSRTEGYLIPDACFLSVYIGVRYCERVKKTQPCWWLWSTHFASIFISSYIFLYVNLIEWQLSNKKKHHNGLKQAVCWISWIFWFFFPIHLLFCVKLLSEAIGFFILNNKTIKYPQLLDRPCMLDKIWISQTWPHLCFTPWTAVKPFTVTVILLCLLITNS